MTVDKITRRNFLLVIGDLLLEHGVEFEMFEYLTETYLYSPKYCGYLVADETGVRLWRETVFAPYHYFYYWSK